MESKKILVIEDDPNILLSLKTILAKEGFTVLEAEDGYQGLEKTKQVLPDLVFSDLYLPRLDGHKVCKIIKSEKNLCHIPVILCSASTLPEDKEWASRVGADGFIQKPFSNQEVVSVVAKLLKLGK